MDKTSLLILVFLLLFPVFEVCGEEPGDDSPAAAANKVIILGLDGATWDIIDPLLEAGKLPNIGSLKESGTYGTLEMTEGIIFSPVIWTSIFTGVDPARHGLTGPETALSVFRRQKAVWNYLNDSGRAATVINVPGTFPPEPVNGCLISGFPFENSTFSNIGGTFISLKIGEDEHSSAAGTCPVTNIDDVNAPDIRITSDIRHGKNGYLIMLSYNGLNQEVILAEHSWSSWLYFDLKTGPRVRARLRILDSTAGREMELYLSPLERIPDETWAYHHTSILSDGIGQAIDEYDPFEIGWWKAIDNRRSLDFLYEYLVENEREHADAGLSIYAQVDGPLFIQILTLLDRVQHIYWPYMDPVSYRDVDSVSIGLYGDLVEESYIEIDRLVGSYLDTVAENTTLLLVSDHGFRSVDWRYIFRETMNDLGRNIRSKGLIKGISRKLFGKGDFFVRPFKGVHEKKGIYIFSGRDIKKDHKGGAAAAVDIAPTVLYILGEKFPDDLDGKILADIFPEEHLESFPPTLIDGSYGVKTAEDRDMDRSAVEQLKSMGYVH